MSALKNPKDEKFAQLVAKGMSQSDAYREVYAKGRTSDEAVWVNASKKVAKVKLRIEQLREKAIAKAEPGAIATIQEMQEGLTKLLRDSIAEGDKDGAVKISTLLGKWQGAEAAAKIEIRNGGVTDDYRAPPHLVALSDEELLSMMGK